MKRRDIALAAALLPFASIFAGSTAFAADAGNLKKLRVGVTAGPAAEILEQVVPLAKAKGLDIRSLNSKTTFSQMQPSIRVTLTPISFRPFRSWSRPSKTAATT